MWEFSINMQSNKSELAASIFNILRTELASAKAIVARSDGEEYISIVLAVPKEHKSEAEIVLMRVVTLAICQSFKADYLNKHLFLPNQDNLSLTAFKKALINFDKETDYFLISKMLNFNEYLYLESFYKFKLVRLREKWGELIRLANENRDYLVSSDAFFDLLKFLIDNLDISGDEIDVVEDDDGYHICEQGGKSGALNSSALVSSLIDLSPQKINMYYRNENNATDLLKTIFDRRIILFSSQPQPVKQLDNLDFLIK